MFARATRPGEYCALRHKGSKLAMTIVVERFIVSEKSQSNVALFFFCKVGSTCLDLVNAGSRKFSVSFIIAER
ncbi:hypothetical protein AB6A40_011273 [Gnathostoma spinigerum]|uniref:Ribosomal protein L14 n=1 Tax=Gnathostoma spinigerum TaxID=75299 RepID=A0ABD6F1G1_9BILA